MKNNLKTLRKERGLTQKQVAILLGLKCEDRISHWEKGQRMPSTQNLLKLIDVYKVDIHNIYSRSNSPKLE